MFNFSSTSRKKIIKIVVLIILVIIMLLLIILGVILSSGYTRIKFISDSPLNIYEKAAVVSNVPVCARIGSDILQYKHGSAVDAAISVLICEGITAPASLGLGGGFLMTIYDAPSGKVEFLNAKEMAPGLATETMFHGDAHLSKNGGLAVAVPGQLLGFWEAHQKYGRVAWRELFEPSIKLCAKDSVDAYKDECFGIRKQKIKAELTFMDVFDEPKAIKLLQKDDFNKQRMTLRMLANAENPVDLFYRGEIAEQLAAEIRQHGGIITPEDLANYKVKWAEPHRAKIDNMTIYTSPPPGSGIMLTFMLNVLKGLVPAENDVILCQRFVETFKFAFAQRGDIADPDFVDTTFCQWITDLFFMKTQIFALSGSLLNEHLYQCKVIEKFTSLEYINHVRSLIKDDKTYDDPAHYGATSLTKSDAGTGHVSVVAPDGSAVSVTSSINTPFGAQFSSQSTGIVFNNQMDDFGSPNIINNFGVPPSPKNFIEPYKRPATSMVPTIVFDENKRVKLVIGTSGGTSIPVSCAYITALYYWNDFNLKEAVDAFRLYHQLFPNSITVEPLFPKNILAYLERIGHKYIIRDRGNAASAIAIDDAGTIAANADYRRGGATAGF